MQELIPLCRIEVGERARVKSLNVRGSMRRRFLDIGLVEDATVECVGRSPSGDPSAYRIRGAIIAIREEDCEGVLTVPLSQREEGERYGTH